MTRGKTDRGDRRYSSPSLAVIVAGFMALALAAASAGSAVRVSTKRLTRTGTGATPVDPASGRVTGSIDVAASTDSESGPVGDCSGIDVAPGQGLAKAVQSAPEGATLCLAPGVYRAVNPIVPRNDQRIIGMEGARIDGSERLTEWSRIGDLWYASGQTQGPTLTRWSGPSLLHKESVYADDVFYDGSLLRRVLSRAELGPGEFFFDYDADRIIIANDPSGHKVEVAVAPALFRGGASAVTV